MSRWFRWYEGTSEDAKFRVVARLSRVTVRDVIALWAFILEDAAHLEHRGVCKRNEDFMAATLDFDDGVVERILEAMENNEMISVGHGAITVCNFSKRQFESDADPTASMRQREKRARDKQPSHTPVTRDSRGSDTDTDTDTDTEDRTEQKDIRAVAKATRPPDLVFEEFKAVYPKRKGANPWKSAFAVFSKLIRDGTDPKEIIGAAKDGVGFDRDKIGTEYIPQAVKWLRDERFRDRPTAPAIVVASGFYVAADTPQMDAWLLHERGAGKSYPRDRNGGWHFPTEWPPGHESEAA